MKKSHLLKIASLAFSITLLAGCHDPKPTMADLNPNAKSVDIIKLDFSNASSIGSKLSKGTSNSRAVSAVAADQSLAGFDDEGNEISVLSLDDELTINPDTMEPVRETYQCKKDGIDAKATGIYSVFAAPYTPKYSDGSAAPSVGQILYTYPAEDGQKSETVDIFNGNTSYTLNTYSKQWEDTDYLTFDNSGKIYMNAKKGDEAVIVSFDPLTKAVTEYTPCGTGKTDVRIGTFTVTGNGEWIFAPVLTEYEKKEYSNANLGHSKLIAINTKDSSKTQTLYDSIIAVKTGQLVSIPYMINDTTLYYNVWECTHIEDDEHPTDYRNTQGGDYFVTINSDGTFTKKRNTTVYFYQVENYIKYLLKISHMEDIDYSLVTDEMYEQTADFIKSFCGTKEPDEIYFSLKNFKDDGEIYKEDSEGNPLCDGAAVKHVFSNKGLFWVLPWIACDRDKIGVSDPNNGAYRSLPINSMFIDKVTGDTVESAADKNYLEKMREGGGITRVASDGIWMTGYIYDENDDKVQYKKSAPVHCMDNNGNYLNETPAAFGDFTAYAGIYAYDFFIADESLLRTEDDPWFKFTIQTSSKGVAYLSENKKSVVYYEDSALKTIASITEGEIFGYELDDETIIYTVKTAENFTSYKANLSSPEQVTELKTEGVLNSAMNVM
ncbi:MAG: hypothetical protein MJ188_11280 [Treponema sp.]|nr:hypothetical protein [Treponema sp.]